MHHSGQFVVVAEYCVQLDCAGRVEIRILSLAHGVAYEGLLVSAARRLKGNSKVWNGSAGTTGSSV